jgi:hypothetical protein
MKYYIYIYSQKEGPYTLEELSNKNLKADTLVWREGLTEWKQAKEFPELHSFIYATPPDPTVTNTPPTPMPKTWFVESILVTIFCCIPFGIIGIIKSNEVEPLWIAGHHEQALIKANEAKKWVMWGFFSMLIFIVLYILFWVCIGVMAAAL